MSKSAISIRNVEKWYGETVHALSDCSIEIEDNEFTVLLGPSGCGKSTLMNVVAGFEDVTSGKVEVFGTPVTAPGPDRTVVFQESALFPWLSVWENVIFGPKINDIPASEYVPRARELLSMVGLAAFHNALPHELSGGMKQRVGIVRALIMSPRVLLMDEPFGALDAQTRLSMQELLLTVWERERKTVLFITHDIDEAILLADKVYVMSARPGRIAEVFPVNLDRPREIDLLTDPEFNRLRGEIMRCIRTQANAALSAA